MIPATGVEPPFRLKPIPILITAALGFAAP
jgi:hypothetical protein